MKLRRVFPSWTPPTPASEFLKRWRIKQETLYPNKSFSDCLSEALIELVASDTPLDPTARSWIAGKMSILYEARDRKKIEVWERRIIRLVEAYIFDEQKRDAKKRRVPQGEAEKIAREAIGKAITTDAVRKRNERATRGIGQKTPKFVRTKTGLKSP